jgi:hypothetical protein
MLSWIQTAIVRPCLKTGFRTMKYGAAPVKTPFLLIGFKGNIEKNERKKISPPQSRLMGIKMQSANNNTMLCSAEGIGTMEREPISKNRVSPKNDRSRRNFLLN